MSLGIIPRGAGLNSHIIDCMPRGKDLYVKPAWWIAYGVLCGLAAAGLILLLVTPRRGQPIELLPAPTLGESGAENALIPSVEPASIFPVNVNTAGLAELDELPGVGPSLAQSIIAYRDANGAYETLEELLEVPGIGTRTFEAILPFITLGEQ